MLCRLMVENYALIGRLDMELSPSLNIITGETGAGKSILLGAIGLLAGGRCAAEVLGDRTRNCVVEGMFDIRGYGLEDFFSDNDLDYDDTAVVRRVVSPAGKSRCYINDLPVQLITLREFLSYLIDIHSQHQNLMLAEDGFRVKVLDAVAGHREKAEEYGRVYHEWRMAGRDLERMIEDAAQGRRDEDWLRYQVEQLEAAALTEGEEAELEALRGELANASEINAALSMAADTLGDDERGVITRLKYMEGALGKIAGYYPRAEEFASRVRESLLELRDVENELCSEVGRIEADPLRLQSVEERLDTIYSLQQKHNVDNTGTLLGLLADFRRRLDAVTDSSEAIEAQRERIRILGDQAAVLAAEITRGRERAGKELSEYVEGTLRDLGMKGCRFEVGLSSREELHATGADHIRFLFSPAEGVEPKPIEKIASGGEVSRVMLAVKSMVARAAKLPTIIFDEIDTGVSGRIADAMGTIISSLADNMQVVNITHLPQVASKGQTHFYVYKDSVDGSVRTKIRLLSPGERVERIAEMLSGNTTTEAAMAQARLLLGL